MLNVIARQEAVRAWVSVHELIDGLPCGVPGSSFAILLSGHAAAYSRGTGTELGSYDTVVGSRRTEITGEGSLALVFLEPREQAPHQ